MIPEKTERLAAHKRRFHRKGLSMNIRLNNLQSSIVGRAGTRFDVVLGFDMATDIEAYTSTYEGIRAGTPKLIGLLRAENVRATFFWTGHAAASNPEMVRRVREAGHETGCHGLFHENLGDAVYPLANSHPVLPSEVEGRVAEATRAVKRIAGLKPVSFRAPRLWGGTHLVNALEKLGYVSDASLPLYAHRSQLVPYHPASKDWTRKGGMRIVEIPNFCDLAMKSVDPCQRDRDPWPIYRTKSARALLDKVDSFGLHVENLKLRPVLCFRFHPWEFHKMPGEVAYGDARVRPAPFVVKNCGDRALEQFAALIKGLKERGARFATAQDAAADY